MIDWSGTSVVALFFVWGVQEHSTQRLWAFAPFQAWIEAFVKLSLLLCESRRVELLCFTSVKCVCLTLNNFFLLSLSEQHSRAT